MKKQILYGITNYEEIVQKNGYFVDKTPYIEKLGYPSKSRHLIISTLFDLLTIQDSSHSFFITNVLP